MPLFYTFHFYLFGIIAVASAIAFVTRKSPVAAALWLVNTMFALAALYVMLDAHFVGVIQVLVYAGAIMVVFLFVVMLLNLGQASDLADMRSRRGRLVAGALGVALAAQLLTMLRARVPALPPESRVPVNAVAPVAENLFTDNLLAFEITSILLLVAIVGAVVLAKPGGAREDASVVAGGVAGGVRRGREAGA